LFQVAGADTANECLWKSNGWMDEDATWYGSRQQCHIVLDGIPALRVRGTKIAINWLCVDDSD